MDVTKKFKWIGALVFAYCAQALCVAINVEFQHYGVAAGCFMVGNFILVTLLGMMIS